MFEPEGDQPLGKAQRDQPLGRGARDLQHLGDLVLGVTGDEIEPAGARGFVETRFFAVGRGHRPHPIRSPEIRHAREHAIGAGSLQRWPGHPAMHSGCRR